MLTLGQPLKVWLQRVAWPGQSAQVTQTIKAMRMGSSTSSSNAKQLGFQCGARKRGLDLLACPVGFTVLQSACRSFLFFEQGF